MLLSYAILFLLAQHDSHTATVNMVEEDMGMMHMEAIMVDDMVTIVTDMMHMQDTDITKISLQKRITVTAQE